MFVIGLTMNLARVAEQVGAGDCAHFGAGARGVGHDGVVMKPTP